jgi:hypothetical protein
MMTVTIAEVENTRLWRMKSLKLKSGRKKPKDEKAVDPCRSDAAPEKGGYTRT